MSTPNQISIPDGKRDLALERSRKVSRALQDAARRSRLTVRGPTAWAGGMSRSGRGSRTFALVSALVIFVLPMLIGGVYFGLIASDQYQADAQFAVRGREYGPIDLLSSASGFISLQQAQDALIVEDYVKSRALVEKIDRELDLRSMFSRDDIDWVSRFDPSDPIEDLVKYWRWKVRLEVHGSGTTDLHCRAFRPEDALKLCEAVLKASEDLVNDISGRSRRDALAKAQAEVKRAEQRLIAVREQTRAARDKERLIDPKKTTEALTKLIGELKLDLAKADNEIAVTSRSLNEATPQIQILRTRREAIAGQIASLERTMTSTDAGGAGTLSQSFTELDRTRLEQEWAEKFYQIVAASYEKARIDTEQQQVYLEAFVKPVLPHSAEFPRRGFFILLIGVGSFAVWFLLNYVRSLTRT